MAPDLASNSEQPDASVHVFRRRCAGAGQAVRRPGDPAKRTGTGIRNCDGARAAPVYVVCADEVKIGVCPSPDTATGSVKSLTFSHYSILINSVAANVSSRYMIFLYSICAD